MTVTSLARPLTNRNTVVDALDLALIAELRHDGRMTHEELSRRVALSRPAVLSRLKRLQENGILTGFTVTADWERLGYPILAFIRVRTNGRCREEAQRIMAMRDEAVMIEECHRTTGEWCLLVKIRAQTSSALEALIDRIRDTGDGVQATMTTLALSTLSS